MKTGNLGSGSSFQLLKRADTDAAPAAFLSASAAWTTTAFTNSTTNQYKIYKSSFWQVFKMDRQKNMEQK